MDPRRDRAAPPAPSFLRGLLAFGWAYRYFVLAPVVLAVLLVGALLLANYAHAPFHYTLR